ncbi:19919_t:CDS:2 [Entrophospora sp. SA101]|nr:8046_t:CDS:2 [Entrophospora sp. SA101]CAJ0828227.1 18568_t:CDS:2 [Entrophospora sp. SA101]CAJ0908314.1 19919_t:CDS:2 [Entrophospora sp. SA101]
MEYEKLKVNSTFLSCEGVQIGCIGNVGQKRVYENHEQPNIKEETSPELTWGKQKYVTDKNSYNYDTDDDDLDYIEEELITEEELSEQVELKKIWIEDKEFAKNFVHKSGPECVINNMNFSDLLRKYQINTYDKAKSEGLEVKVDHDEILALSSILVLRDQPSQIEIDILEDYMFNAISNSVRKIFISQGAAKTSLDSYHEPISKHIYCIYSDRIENLPNKKKNLVEDTFTNNDLGLIFRPLFHDVNDHYLYWSNGSSKSSKKQHGALDCNLT